MQRNLLEYLERTAAESPDALAFSDGERTTTFGELRDRALRIGSELLRLGVRGEPVPVLMDKSPDAPAAFYGAMYAGCYYVPLDSELGRARIGAVLEQVRAQYVICDAASAELAAELGCAVLSFDELIRSQLDLSALSAVRASALDVDPAYVIFTSGTTGVPKGVVATHRGVLNYIDKLGELLNLDGATVFGNQAPLYVDTCQKELYSTLKFGVPAYFIPRELFSFPVRLIDFLNAHRINTICWVASALAVVSALNTFKSMIPGYLRIVTFGGEVLAPKHLRAWRAALPGARFFNLYGPSEVTGASAYYEVTRDFADDEVIPIGKPFPNSGIILHDGEIYLRGAGVTAGYFRDSERTISAFVQNPTHSDYLDVVYRTGDLARYNDDGELVFIARSDLQIKHMGYRIELPEIESAAESCDGVELSCCVYDREKSRIALHYCGSAAERDVRAHLESRLPHYMQPHRVLQRSELPTLPNGKLDREALSKS